MFSRTLLSLLFVFFSTSLWASHEWDIKIVDADTPPTIALRMVATTMSSQVCIHQISKMDVHIPKKNFLEDYVGIPMPPVGLISLETYLPPNTPCLQVIGYHRASITFNKGDTLPELKEGYYKLKINGQDYDYLFVGWDKSFLTDQLPQ